jgi:hypothetical protein
MQNKTIKYASKSTETFLLNRMKKECANGFLKRGTFSNEIVWGAYSYIVPCLDKKKQLAFKRGMFLFGLVRADAKKFLEAHDNLKLPKKYAQIQYATNEIDKVKKVTGTDLNHAYWRIAYNLGILSENTYLKGLDDSFKAVRLAALSTLGGNKKYQKIIDGEITDEYYIVEGDEQLQNVYRLIRYTCYKYMNEVKKMLGKDFLAYKTDCIYYVDTKTNRMLVNEFFERHRLLMKQLE